MEDQSKETKSRMQISHRVPQLLSILGFLFAAAIGALALLAPDLLPSLLNLRGQGQWNQVFFGGVFGLLIAIIPMAHIFGNSFQEMRDNLDSIEKRLTKADEGSTIWDRLEKGPVAHDILKNSIREVTEIPAFMARTTPIWFNIAEEELHKAAAGLGEAARAIQAGSISIQGEDWTRLEQLFRAWAGTVKATSAPSIDGDDFWRDTGERKNYMALQKEALESGRIQFIKRLFLIDENTRTMLQSETQEAVEFLQTIKLNISVGVDAQFLDTNEVDDYIVFMPDGSAAQGLTYIYTIDVNGQNERTTLSIEDNRYIQLNEDFDTRWAQARTLEEFLRYHNLKERYESTNLV